MQFTHSKLFAFAVAAQAIGIASAASAATAVSESPLSPLDFSTGISCTNSFLSGVCGNNLVSSIPSGCFNFFPNFTDDISSIMVISGFSCNFVDPNCVGAVLTVTGTVDNLAGTNFQDSLSSYQCNNA